MLLGVFLAGCTVPRSATSDDWTYTVVDQSDPMYRSSLREIVTAAAGQPMTVVVDSAGVLNTAYGAVIVPSASSTTYEDVSLSSVQDSTMEIEIRAGNNVTLTSPKGTPESSKQIASVERRSIPIRSLVRIDAQYPDDAVRAEQRRRQAKLQSIGTSIATFFRIGAMVILGLLSLVLLISGLLDPAGARIILLIMGLLGVIGIVTYFIPDVTDAEDPIMRRLKKPSNKVRKSWFFAR